MTKRIMSHIYKTVVEENEKIKIIKIYNKFY